MLAYTQMKDKLLRLSEGSEGGFVICISNSAVSGEGAKPVTQSSGSCEVSSEEQIKVRRECTKVPRGFCWEFWERQPEISPSEAAPVLRQLFSKRLFFSE